MTAQGQYPHLSLSPGDWPVSEPFQPPQDVSAEQVPLGQTSESNDCSHQYQPGRCRLSEILVRPDLARIGRSNWRSCAQRNFLKYAFVHFYVLTLFFEEGVDIPNLLVSFVVLVGPVLGPIL